MQKVKGSSPFIRFTETPANGGGFAVDGTGGCGSFKRHCERKVGQFRVGAFNGGAGLPVLLV
jgi:hypothetical protein